MSSREIVLWLDERWYSALNRHLKNETAEEHLENVLDELCNQLPEREYKRISCKLWEEEQANKLVQEANRRFAVFHVIEGGSETYFLAEEKLELLQVAVRLRDYIRKTPENIPEKFAGMFSRGESISPEQYNTYVLERAKNTGRVAGAFEIDFDKGRFKALHIMDGWLRYRIRDVSTAAYFATRKSSAQPDERWALLLEHLEGKELPCVPEPWELSGSRPLCAEDISFAEDIIQNGKLLEFYMEMSFDTDEVFGKDLCNVEDGDWMNIYANYNLVQGCVHEKLTVILMRGDGGEEQYQYQLGAEERELLLPKMEEYCKLHWGQSLEQCCADYRAEQQTGQSAVQEMLL